MRIADFKDTDSLGKILCAAGLILAALLLLPYLSFLWGAPPAQFDAPAAVTYDSELSAQPRVKHIKSDLRPAVEREIENAEAPPAPTAQGLHEIEELLR